MPRRLYDFEALLQHNTVIIETDPSEKLTTDKQTCNAPVRGIRLHRCINIVILVQKINHLAVKVGMVLPYAFDGLVYAVNSRLSRTSKLSDKCLEAISEQPGSTQIGDAWRLQKGDQFLWDLSHSHPMGHYEPVYHLATL